MEKYFWSYENEEALEVDAAEMVLLLNLLAVNIASRKIVKKIVVTIKIITDGADD